MPVDPRHRASDADRERTAELLREHHAVGRLTAEEFDERLNKVFAAKTVGELDELLADVPAIDLYELPSAGIRPASSRQAWRGVRPGGQLDRRVDGSVARQVVGWTAWIGIGSMSMLIWLGLGITYGGLAWLPWFLLIVVPWAVALGRGPRRG